jgi:hypothetical protein
MGRQRVDDESPERVVPDAPDDPHAHAQTREVHRRVRGASADQERQRFAQHQLAGARQPVDRHAEMVGHQDAGAQAVDVQGEARC